MAAEPDELEDQIKKKITQYRAVIGDVIRDVRTSL